VIDWEPAPVVIPAPAPALDVRRCRLLGFVGSAALAAGGLTAGALPVRETPAAPGALGPAVGLVSAYFGLILLVAAWTLLGCVVRGPRPPGSRTLLLTLAVWAAPLLLAPPLFSRDVYSYLAQGAMVDAEMDVYTHGPSRLGGPLADEVSPPWQHTPTPYGPVFLASASAVAQLTKAGAEAGLQTGVLGMRLVALLGVVLMVMALPVLARHCGNDPAAALWLGALNPLVLLHLVGGAHNDAVMLGLLGAGLVAALGGRSIPAAALVALAALVKAPAALGLLAVATLWSQRLTGRSRWLRAVAATGAVALATTGLATAATGTGYGWIGALNTPVTPDNWAPVNTLGRATGAMLTSLGSGLAEFASPIWRLLGLAATAVVVLTAWRRHSRLGGPVLALGVSLMAVAVLGPAIRPWYVLWSLFLIAAAAPRGPLRRAVATASGVLALAIIPSGFAPSMREVLLATAGGVLGVVALLASLAALWWGRHIVVTIGARWRERWQPEQPT
jgi:alpha-1,6-mannosyltransferase